MVDTVSEGGAPRRGRFIVLEGLDASGKSTQVDRLAAWLETRGSHVHVTAEPTSGPIGSLIRQSFAGRVPLDDRVIAALFVADRIDHLTNARDGVLGFLERGIDVVSDRYVLSSLAYQSGDVGMEWVLHANEVATRLLRPDLTIYLDLPPAAALRRLETRRGIPDRFEELERLTRAYADYELAIEMLHEKDSIVRIAATGTPDEVAERVRAAVAGEL
ncbi:dTMP kinase [Microbacterium sp. X-17]|uniref:dTMP kinase n=1 Tax=Microbacterium sp. X-17 TaxID=3144404 RepID=UPI0031F485F0